MSCLLHLRVPTGRDTRATLAPYYPCALAPSIGGHPEARHGPPTQASAEQTLTVRRRNTSYPVVDKGTTARERPTLMSAPQQPPARNRLGAVAFVVAVLGATLAVIPATAAFGGLLCIIAIIPAIVSFRRVRKGTANNRRQSVAALVLAPVFFIVAVSLSPSPPANTTAEDRTPMSKPASTPALQQSSPASTPALQQSSPAITPLPALAPAPRLAPAPAPAPVRAATPAPARAGAPVPAPAAAPPNAGSPTGSTDSSSAGSTGGSPYYANCAAARSAGVAPLHKGDPGYRSGLDRDGDGIACE